MTFTPDTKVLDEFLDMVKEAMPKLPNDLRDKQKQELEMWNTWNNSGRKPEHLQPLLQSYQPLIQKRARNWIGQVEMPASTIHHEFNKQFVNAVKTYNPNMKTQLGSWVFKNLSKASRYMKTYQNFGRIPESQISHIGEFLRIKTELSDTLGHEPDTISIADRMSLPVKKVEQLQKELSRKDRPTSLYEFDPAEILAPKEIEAVRILQYDPGLSSEERAVYEYTHGMGGKPMLKPGEIAKRTGIHPSKISRIRNKLQAKIREAASVL